MSERVKVRVVYDPVIGRWVGEVVRGDALLMAYFANSYDVVSEMAHAYAVQVVV